MNEMVILIVIMVLLTFIILYSERRSFQLSKKANLFVNLVKVIIICLVGLLFLLCFYNKEICTVVGGNTKLLAKDTNLVKIVNISEDGILTLEDGSKVENIKVSEYTRTAYGTGSYFDKSSGMMVAELTLSDVKNMVMLGNVFFLYVMIILLCHIILLNAHRDSCSNVSLDNFTYAFVGTVVSDSYFVFVNDKYNLLVTDSNSLITTSQGISLIMCVVFTVLFILFSARLVVKNK